MINLVTVTYNLEQHLLRLQAESLQNYCKPLRHWVIVNERDVDVHGWYDYLRKYYEHHELYILPRRYLCSNPLVDSMRGWATQQVLKFLIARIIQDDYILLDSKNFFIQEFDFSIFDDYIGSGYLETTQEDIKEDVETTEDVETKEDEDFLVVPMATRSWEPTIEIYSDKLGIKQVPKYFLAPGTPFKVDYKNLIDRANLNDIFETLLFHKEIEITSTPKEIACPSEFLFYSLICNDLIQPGINTMKKDVAKFNHTLFPDSFDREQKIIASGYLFTHIESVLNADKNIKLFGLHKDYLNRCGPQHYREINFWLSNKGFKFQFA